MKKARGLEMGVGLFMLLGIGALVFLALKVSHLAMSGNDVYMVTARFENVDGLKERAPVKIGGVKVGEVELIDYDQSRYESVVTLKIRKRYDKLPEDTSASIFSSGLLGEKYVSLEPGGDEEFLGDGGTITLTQSVLIIEQMIGKLLVSMGKGEDQ